MFNVEGFLVYLGIVSFGGLSIVLSQFLRHLKDMRDLRREMLGVKVSYSRSLGAGEKFTIG